jgi:hypothetical protein
MKDQIKKVDGKTTSKRTPKEKPIGNLASISLKVL